MAPLTLLVGENSTGKTSLLALIRALWQLAFRDEVPDFREEPYDLGTFADVVHNRGGRGKLPASFQAGFGYDESRYPERDSTGGVSFHATFEGRSAFPFPVKRGFRRQEAWFDVEIQEGGSNVVRYGGADIEKEYLEARARRPIDDYLVPVRSLLREVLRRRNGISPDGLGGLGKENPDEDGVTGWMTELDRVLSESVRLGFPHQVPFAGAPVRSRPRRTYDPGRPWQDPEGQNIPAYLASTFHRDPRTWEHLKNALEEFGRESGLFDEISIQPFGKSEATPFQVLLRKFGRRLKGPQRNLVDVGYGVSQVLPVITELLDHDADSPELFLLQQPEIHLHPKAQAALGSLLCMVSGIGRQLIVETHSDYLLDRVRMEVRDKKTVLAPEDVSILYFEPGELEVKIHSLRLDELGNVLDAPPGYGQFFMDEVRRSIGL